MTFDPLSNLTADGSFWDLRKLSRRLRSKYSRRNWTAIVGVGVAAFAAAAATGNADVGQLARDTSTTIFTFATTILGILIAGFAIFTTIASTDVAKSLALLEHEKTGISTIKWMSLHFVRVFIRYIEFVALHCVIWLFGFKGGIASIVAAWFTTPQLPFGKLAASAIFGLLAGYMVLLLIELAAFVYNVHAGFMAMVRGRIDPYAIKLVEIQEQDLKEEAEKKFAAVGAAVALLVDAEDNEKKSASEAESQAKVVVRVATRPDDPKAQPADEGHDDESDDDLDTSRRRSH